MNRFGMREGTPGDGVLLTCLGMKRLWLFYPHAAYIHGNRLLRPPPDGAVYA